MKIRSSIFWFIVIIVVLIAGLLWYGKNKPTETPLVISTETNVTMPAVTAQNQPVSAHIGTNAPTTQMVKSADLSKSPPESKGQRMLEVLSAYNDVPINFYGRVEDQFSNAVDNAAVNFNVRVENGIESTVKRGQVMTDGNGFFTISGYKGQDLGLVPQKAGYVLATTGTHFKYSHMEEGYYVPDQNNPTVIKMWKLQGAEPLVKISKEYKLHYTNEPINFDLLEGKVVPDGGDIKIIVSRSPGVISGRNRLDWSVQVEAVDGGVLDSGGQEAVTYAAPADGYQSNMTFMFSTNAPYKWSGGFNQGFFIMSRKGQVYSKIGLSVGINDKPDDYMYFIFGGVANANGSRNWEATAPQ